MKILIADDSKLSRATLTDALEEFGHQVLTAENGEQAIQLFQDEEPDLVILDVVMDTMSGFECASKIRALDENDWIPIIFLSSSIDDEYIAQGIDAGGDDYLTKPFSKITLSAKIKAMERIAEMRRELIETTQKLNRLSRTDPLTGLYNRLEFDKKLTQAIAVAKRHGQKFALLFIDIDRFKSVNDELGHHAGDQLIKEVADRLTSCLRVNDFIARLGGDEFAIIIQPIEHTSAPESLAKKITQQAAEPFIKERPISFSIGIACYPETGTDQTSLLIHADKAMYHVKKAGGNGFSVYTEQH